jgi:hypothetical protein
MSPRQPGAQEAPPLGSAGPGHHLDLRDPVNVAVKVTGLEGQVALMQQALSTGLSNVTSTLSAVQGEQQDLRREMARILESLHALKEHGSGLERLAQQIKDAGDGFNDWRREHEKDNQAVLERVNVWRGVIIGVCILAGSLAASVIYIVQDGFSDARAEQARLEHRIEVLEGRRAAP